MGFFFENQISGATDSTPTPTIEPTTEPTEPPDGGILDGWSDFLQGFNNFVSSFGSFLNSFNPASEDFFLKKAFIPSEGYFEDRYEDFEETIQNSFGYIPYLSYMESLEDVEAIDGSYQQTVEIYGVGDVSATWLNTEAYDENRSWIYTAIRAVLAVGLVLFNINQVYRLFNRGATILSVGRDADASEGGKKK
jgi:hypothetical protein